MPRLARTGKALEVSGTMRLLRTKIAVACSEATREMVRE
jgi:hypothetical protein